MEEYLRQEPQQKPPQEQQLEPMQDTFEGEQQVQPGLEYNNQNDQGDFRRRLRDRDLLKKRKAEAEEKETDEWDFGTEIPKKRGRSGAKRGRRRGRPRKTEQSIITDAQNESLVDQEATVAVTEAVLSQIPVPLEAQLPEATMAAPAFEECNNPTPQAPAADLEPAVDLPPIPIQDVAPPSASAARQLPLDGAYTEPQSEPGQAQVVIEDVGPDPDEEDFCPSQDKQTDGCSGPGTPEAIFLSNPAFSTPAPLQDYLQRNAY
ncbi:unnamed protein product [Knipowitschia caucasica]